MRKITSGVATIGAAALIAVIGASSVAVAGALIDSSDIRDDSVRSIDIHNGTLRAADFSDNTVAQFSKPGAQGPAGPAGADSTVPGPKGDKGEPGDSIVGPKGDTGATGAAGRDGTNAQALPYGVAQVKVQRGAGAATPWATYSTTVGSPVGDTTGGTFRFTCSEANAPCKVSVAGYGTEDGMTVYPRVNIQKQSLNGGPQNYCEYGDGPMSGALTTSPAPLTLHIGGSDDCGLNGPAGALSEITVPAGYYDVTSTFQFVG